MISTELMELTLDNPSSNTFFSFLVNVRWSVEFNRWIEWGWSREAPSLALIQTKNSQPRRRTNYWPFRYRFRITFDPRTNFLFKTEPKNAQKKHPFLADKRSQRSKEHLHSPSLRVPLQSKGKRRIDRRAFFQQQTKRKAKTSCNIKLICREDWSRWPTIFSSTFVVNEWKSPDPSISIVQHIHFHGSSSVTHACHREMKEKSDD